MSNRGQNKENITWIGNSKRSIACASSFRCYKTGVLKHCKAIKF